MKRKHFLQHTAALAPFLIAFNPLAAVQKKFLQYFVPQVSKENRILVLIELVGGNDGLNTVIPIDKYSQLSVARRDILIPENKILPLNDTAVFGLHPSLTGLQNLYNNKLLSLVQGVGYAEAEYSHFRAKAIKYTANTQKEELRSGWLGRYLAEHYPDYPHHYPLHNTDGPPAFRIGSSVSPKTTQGIEEDFSIGIANLTDMSTSAAIPEDNTMGSNPASEKINKIKAVAKQIRQYAPIIEQFAARQQNLSKLYPEPEKNLLADQLKTVARLIGSGINTRVYLVGQTDYDTHADQVDKADTTKGKHAALLRDLSEAITAFQDDLQLMGKQDEVLGMTFSEFGRRIASGSYGTDHGSSETNILFGTQLNHGIIGKSPELPAKITIDDNLPVQFDFRSLYKTILTDWFGVPLQSAKAIINQGPDEKIDLFKG